MSKIKDIMEEPISNEEAMEIADFRIKLAYHILKAWENENF